MRPALLAVIVALPAAAQASPLESAWTESQLSFSAALPAARAVMASSQDEALRDRLYLLANDAQKLEKKYSDDATKTGNVTVILEVVATGKDGPKDVQGLLDIFSDDFARLNAPTAALKDALRAVQGSRPGAEAGAAARALRNAVLRLRASAEGLKSETDGLAAKVQALKGILLPESGPAAKKLVEQSQALGSLLDDAVAAVEKLVKKG